MAEIDSVYLSITAHFQCYGNPETHKEELTKLAGTLIKCASSARARISGIEPEKRIAGAEDRIMLAHAATAAIDAGVNDPKSTKTTDESLISQGWNKDDASDSAKNPFVGVTLDKIVTADYFKQAAELAMIARRSLHPLEGETPWADKIDPAVALRDDDDPYSFSIFDSLIEPIQELLPPLYQLAAEGWVPSDEEGPEQIGARLDSSLRGVIDGLVGVMATDEGLTVLLSRASTASSKLPTTFEGLTVQIKVLDGGIQPVEKSKPRRKPSTDPKTVKCPLCSVNRGKGCVTKAGKPARNIHQDRINARLARVG